MKKKLHEEVAISLNLVEEQENIEENPESDSDSSEEFGGNISEIKFPEFGDEKGIIEIGFDKEMIIFKAEFEEWKKKLQ